MQITGDYALKFFPFFSSFIYFQEWVFPNNQEVFMTFLFECLEKKSSFKHSGIGENSHKYILKKVYNLS